MGISINIGGGGRSRHHGGFGRRRYRRSRPATPLGTMIGGGIAVIIGIAIVFLDQSSAAQTAEILENGQRAEATVTNSRTETDVSHDSEGRRRTRTNYYVSLQFTDEDQQTRNITDKRVARRIYNAASGGGTMQIAYMGNDLAFPEHESGESNPWIGIIVAIIGLLLAGFGFFQFQKQRGQADAQEGGDGSEGSDEDGGPELREQDESQQI